MPAKNAKYIHGYGSRKAATATARLYKGKGEITINGKPALEFLSGNKTLMAEITDPLAMTQKQKEYDVTVLAKGGGVPYMTTGKTIALTRRTFVGKIISLLFNMLSRLVITFLPRSKHLLISWL